MSWKDRKILSAESIPIAVYLPSEQKLILVFESASKAAKYLFDDRKKSNCIVSKTKSKRRITFSLFNQELAVRAATSDQAKMLGSKSVICLDDRFRREIKITSAFTGINQSAKERSQKNAALISHQKAVARMRTPIGDASQIKRA